MNHCIDCGHRISRGRRWGTANETTRCLLCQTAQVMTTFRYVSPYMQRYYAKKEGKHEMAQHPL